MPDSQLEALTTVLINENSLLHTELDCFSWCTLAFDRHGVVLHANAKMIDLLGVTPEVFSNGIRLNEIFLSESNTQDSIKKAIEIATEVGYWKGHSTVIQRTAQYRTTIRVRHTMHRCVYTQPSTKISTTIFCSVLKPIKQRTYSNDTFSLYHSLIQAIPAGMCIWHCPNPEVDRTFRLEAINQKAQEIIGIALTPGSRLQEIIDVASNPLVPEFFWAVMVGGSPVYRPQFTLGQNRFSLTAFPLRDYCLGMMFEPPKIQESESVQVAQTIISSSSANCIVQLHLDQITIISVNNGMRIITGHSHEEIIGQDLTQLFTETDSGDKSFSQILFYGESGTVRGNLQTKHNGVIYCQVGCHPLADSNWQCDKYMLFFDPTPRAPTPNPEKELSIFRKIFDWSESGILVWELRSALVNSYDQLSPSQVCWNFFLVHANSFAYHMNLFDPSQPEISLREQFPNLVQAGVIDNFHELLQSGKPLQLGEIVFGQCNSDRVIRCKTQVIPLEHAEQKFIIIILRQVPFHSGDTPTPSMPANSSSPHAGTSNTSSDGDSPDSSLSAWSRGSLTVGYEDDPGASSYLTEPLWKEIVYASPFGVMVLNSYGFLCFVNSAVLTLLQYEEADVRMKAFTDFLQVPDEAQYVKHILMQLHSSKGGKFVLNLHYRQKFGAIVNLLSQFRHVQATGSYITVFLQHLDAGLVAY